MTMLSAVLLSFGARAATNIQENNSSITLSAGVSRLVFNKSDGTVTSLRLGSIELVKDKSGLRPDFWREMTTEDFSNNIPERSAKWKKLSVTGTETATEPDGAVSLRVTYEPDFTLTYKLYGNGMLDVSLLLPPSAEPFQEPIILDGPGMVYDPNRSEEELRAEIERFRSAVEFFQKEERKRWLQEQALIPCVGMLTRLPAKFVCQTHNGKLVATDARSRGFVLQPLTELQFSTLSPGSFTELRIDAPQPEKEEIGAYNLPSDEIHLSFRLVGVKDAASLAAALL